MSDRSDVVREEASEDRPELAIHASRWTELGNAGLSLVLAAITAFMALTLLGRGDLMGLFFAAIPPWMGWSAMRWLRRWRSARPVLTVNEEGILDATAPGAPTLIAWSEIEAVSGDGAKVALTLREGSDVRRPLSQRLLGWLTRSPAGDYLIPTRGLDTPPYAVEAHLRERHEVRLLREVTEARALPPGPE